MTLTTLTLQGSFCTSDIALAALCYVWFQTGVHASCASKPVLNSNTYTVSEDKTSYALNETYEIYCIPGYKTTDSNNLICQATGKWDPGSPTCEASEGTYPWWMLLVAVMVIILVVACVIPRFLQCCLGKAKKKTKKDVERNDSRDDNDGYDDDDDDDDRAESPVPDFRAQRGKKMSNMEFMTKLHKDVDKKGLKRANKNATF